MHPRGSDTTKASGWPWHCCVLLFFEMSFGASDTDVDLLKRSWDLPTSTGRTHTHTHALTHSRRAGKLGPGAISGTTLFSFLPCFQRNMRKHFRQKRLKRTFTLSGYVLEPVDHIKGLKGVLGLLQYKMAAPDCTFLSPFMTLSQMIPFLYFSKHEWTLRYSVFIALLNRSACV